MKKGARDLQKIGIFSNLKTEKKEGEVKKALIWRVTYVIIKTRKGECTMKLNEVMLLDDRIKRKNWNYFIEANSIYNKFLTESGCEIILSPDDIMADDWEKAPLTPYGEFLAELRCMKDSLNYPKNEDEKNLFQFWFELGYQRANEVNRQN